MSRLAFILASCGAALLVAACGDDNEGVLMETSEPASVATQALVIQNQPQPVQAPNGPPQQPEDGVYEITAIDTAFQGNEVEVAVNSAAVIRVRNAGQQTHNLRLAGLDGQFDTEDDAVTEPVAIEPGSFGEFSFAPAIPGAYTFRCDYHPGSMGGRITVS